jgi:hypothetical protein
MPAIIQTVRARNDRRTLADVPVPLALIVALPSISDT